jgi:acetaldehyde/propanal dehydrogenase
MSAARVPVAIIGPGNIGTDLAVKAMRSEWLRPVFSVGIDEHSSGLAKARELGIATTHEGVDGLLSHLASEGIRIAFDATSAYVHAENSRKLEAHGVRVIDLTPAAIGPFCIPPVNLHDPGVRDAPNVNMVSCGAQATVPMVAAVSRVQPVAYGEIIATVASKSIGPGTRNNIDEFTRTTARAVEAVGGAKQGKAIIIINPAEPPILMRDTVHCLVDGEPDVDAITASVHAMVAEVQTYVPGYRLTNGPVFDGQRVSIYLEVTGRGDWLPPYAGNLDIMTAAALRTGELFAQSLLRNANTTEAPR